MRAETVSYITAVGPRLQRASEAPESLFKHRCKALLPECLIQQVLG